MTTAVTGLQTDVLVIGAGLSGSAAAWKLTELGYDVIVVDRDVPASDRGSSHGSARILRYAYPDPLYTGLMVEAKKGWDELERRNGRRLVTPSGSLDVGGLRDPEELARVLDGAGVENELLSADVAADRWPGLSFDPALTGSDKVLWHPDAGVINAEATVTAQLAEAKKSGRPSSSTGRRPRSAVSEPTAPATPSPPPPVRRSRRARSSSPPAAGSLTCCRRRTCPTPSSPTCPLSRSARRTPTTSPTGTRRTAARWPTVGRRAGPR